MLITIAAAGYAAYAAKQQKSAEIRENDPEIDTGGDGKAFIDLMPLEQDLLVMEQPISTVTFMNGDYVDVVPYLEHRVEEIIAKNPWLGGWLTWHEGDGRIKICYDETGKHRCAGHFHAYEPFVVPIIRDKTEYKVYVKLLKSMGALVPSNLELAGKNLPFWKVVVVPDADVPNERYALVVSMSHAVGDAHTYYQLLNMLRKDGLVMPLDPFRLPEYKVALTKLVGATEADYLWRAVQQPPLDLTGSSREQSVLKLFYVSDKWVLQKKKEVEAEAGEEVSANSVLTSYFFRLNVASIGMMVMDLRNRLDGTPLGDANAGNYLYPIIYTHTDYLSPVHVHKSVKGFRRCGPDTPPELPAFGWDMTSSISVSWTKHFDGKIRLQEDAKNRSTEIHLPIWDIEIRNILPSRVSCMQLFTAGTRETATTGDVVGSRGGNDRTHVARVGAFVMCLQPEWEDIEATGMGKSKYVFGRRNVACRFSSVASSLANTVHFSPYPFSLVARVNSGRNDRRGCLMRTL